MDIFTQGTSGRIQDYKFTASSTTDMPPGFGDNAAVISPLPTTTIAGELNNWKLSDSVNSEPVYTFESPANSEGVAYPIHLRGGLSPGAKIQISGVYNRSATKSSARFMNGGYVLVDLIIFKLTGFGYLHTLCKVVSIENGAEMAGKAQPFSCTLEVQGVPPIPSLT